MPHGPRQIGKVAGGVLLGLALLAAVVVVAGRVGGTARFVTWPIVALALLAAMVSLVGVWVGLDRPGLLAAGVLPGLIVAYVLPVAPLTLVAGVLSASPLSRSAPVASPPARP